MFSGKGAYPLNIELLLIDVGITAHRVSCTMPLKPLMPGGLVALPQNHYDNILLHAFGSNK